jgi:alcohol dehydrogenase
MYTSDAGSFAIQFARAFGAHVIATASKAGAELVKSLGADEVLDYTAANFSTPLESDASKVDIVYDTVGGFGYWSDVGRRVLKPGGSYITIAGDGHEKMSLGMLARAGYRQITRSWPFEETKYVIYSAFPDGAQLAHIAQLMEEGKIRGVVDSTFPLSDAAAAFARLQTGRARGKVVVVVISPPK